MTKMSGEQRVELRNESVLSSSMTVEGSTGPGAEVEVASSVVAVTAGPMPGESKLYMAGKSLLSIRGRDAVSAC